MDSEKPLQIDDQKAVTGPQQSAPSTIRPRFDADLSATSSRPSGPSTPRQAHGREGASGSPLWTALNLAWELGYTIVIPLVLFALLGRYADKQYGTSPWLLLSGMALAIVITTIALVRKFSKLIAQMNPPKS